VGTLARVVVVIPAHNEAARIASTIDSLKAQQRLPDRVLVVADNCTDSTVRIAREAGVEVLESVGNTQKKAGALNQALARLLPALDENDFVLVMDADSTIAEDFISVALRHLGSDARIGAVGGVFHGEPGGGLLAQLQRNEYVRYSREVDRRDGRLFVLSGTASLFRVKAMREVAQARGTILPGTHGRVYDTLALTEDNEITLALKTLGWTLLSPRECRVQTEVMLSWGALWRQRLRWQRGALENLGHYGWTPVTRRYWGQQAGLFVGVFAFLLYIFMSAVTLALGLGFTLQPFWVGVGALFALERVVTVWSARCFGRLIALPLVIELAYDVFQQVVFLRSLVDIALRRQAQWGATLAISEM
jgi:biofilm PGA synthesis N-glycosyltransferase PgaC